MNTVSVVKESKIAIHSGLPRQPTRIERTDISVSVLMGDFLRRCWRDWLVIPFRPKG